ncbi:uncharacterized protein HKW66_Vig0128050 [Vigna angularis]|uniref:Uncharacterized protein n=1 Tax=Phaseolus angularis TaxID=3914 RepID=A0A8T0K2T4_PHAAN|nr:uncharacterized protein HKW66_Vig0128050 [Vigna angularis]
MIEYSLEKNIATRGNKKQGTFQDQSVMTEVSAIEKKTERPKITANTKSYSLNLRRTCNNLGQEFLSKKHCRFSPLARSTTLPPAFNKKPQPEDHPSRKSSKRIDLHNKQQPINNNRDLTYAKGMILDTLPPQRPPYTTTAKECAGIVVH